MNSFCNSILKKMNEKNTLDLDKLQHEIYNLTQKKWGIKLNLGWGIKLNLDRKLISKLYHEIKLLSHSFSLL